MRAGPRLALRVAWDLFRIPLIHRRVGRWRARRHGGVPAGVIGHGWRRRPVHGTLPPIGPLARSTPTAPGTSRSSIGSTRRPGSGSSWSIVACLIYWLSNRILRRDPRRLLLPRRRVPPRPRLARRPRSGFQDVIVRRRPHLRPVRAVPGGRPDADRRDLRARRRRPVGDRDQRRARRVDGRARPGGSPVGPASARSSTGCCSSSCSGSRPRSGGSRPAAASGIPAT